MRWLVVAFLVAGCSVGAPPAAPVVPTAFVAPTLAPTPTPPHGTGIVTFGSAGSLDKSTLKVNPSKTSFKATVKKIAWSASFSEHAGATSLTLIIARKGSGGTETPVHSEKFEISNPEFDIVGSTEDLGAFVNRKPGTYVLRILRGGTTLADGEFTLTK